MGSEMGTKLRERGLGGIISKNGAETGKIHEDENENRVTTILLSRMDYHAILRLSSIDDVSHSHYFLAMLVYVKKIFHLTPYCSA